MRHILILCGLLVGALAAPAFADTKIAVISTQEVLSASDAARKAGEKFNADTRVQRDTMDKLKAEIQGLQAKYQKDSAVMSDKDKQALQQQANEKAAEYQKLGQTVVQDKQQAEEELQQMLIPKVRAILEDMRKTNKYDIILERQGVVISYDPAMDITKKVIERLNAATAAGK